MKIIRPKTHQLTRDEMLQLYREAIVTGVPLEEVQRRVGSLTDLLDTYQAERKQTVKQIKTKERKRKIMPLVMVTVGSMMMANALWPILSHSIFVAPQLQIHELQAPIPREEVLESSSLSIDNSGVAPVSANSLLPRPIVVQEELDYTNLANWFGEDAGATELARAEESQQVYLIDIPSLNIEKAEIKVGGTDLNSHLIQYPNTAQPGELGAPVIFGHSVLRQFYNPALTNPRRYKSIFSKIMTLKQGEQIFITYQGRRYTYSVINKAEVKPEDTYILEQYHDRRELKLVTCVPEGTYLHRGVVTSKLDAIETVE